MVEKRLQSGRVRGFWSSFSFRNLYQGTMISPQRPSSKKAGGTQHMFTIFGAFPQALMQALYVMMSSDTYDKTATRAGDCGRDIMAFKNAVVGKMRW